MDISALNREKMETIRAGEILLSLYNPFRPRKKALFDDDIDPAFLQI